MFDGTMHALIATIDAKDPYTRGHSARVADFAHLLATHAGLDAAEADQARLCGLVHDIGKIGVSEDVLRKPGKLTDEEFQQIAAHPVIGHDILRGIPRMSDVLSGVLHHHERFAGGGYPHGISGEKIPLLGRLISIADALDAMTTSRTYRGARPMSAALEEITRCAGTHFDPELAKAIVSIDRRKLQSIVGLHVFGAPVALPPHPERRADMSFGKIHPEITRRTA
jgi:HD-GYP domain-containing protein (c-di-GMP phosphodiesterase class II)